MAGNKAKAVIGKSQLATGKGKTNPQSKSKTNLKTKRRKLRAKTRRPARTHDDYQKVTTFPSVKGKVVREVRFSHDDPNNVLAIAFKDRSVLYFDINPEALILPLEVSAHYIGETHSARRSWEGLAGAGKPVFSI